MRVKEAMNNNVITITSNTRPAEAFQKMYKEGVRRLFVMDEGGEPLGVVSYSDLIGVLGTIKPSAKDAVSLQITDIMSKEVMTISADDRIEDAANLMLRADISGLLVLADDKPVGVIQRLIYVEFVELLVPV